MCRMTLVKRVKGVSAWRNNPNFTPGIAGIVGSNSAGGMDVGLL